jgi:hypothetical protein
MFRVNLFVFIKVNFGFVEICSGYAELYSRITEHNLGGVGRNSTIG